MIAYFLSMTASHYSQSKKLQENEKWFFPIVDVCGVLTDSKDALTAK